MLILTIIVILIVCRRRSTLAERQYKKMKAQLDALESNVRNECKQGSSKNYIPCQLLFFIPLLLDKAEAEQIIAVNKYHQYKLFVSEYNLLP